MTIEEVEEKLSNMHFDSIVKSYCNKINDIKRLKAENDKLKEQLPIHNLVGRGEQLLAFKEWERDKCKLRWDAEPKEIVEQYLSQNVTYYISNRDKNN